ncbi:MAG TPA: hypothetical protein VMW24_15225 [Sedimentisphaerales bacterium]|nr:hypothetical protein [Sedimentisphaerales bacterium]
MKEMTPYGFLMRSKTTGIAILLLGSALSLGSGAAAMPQAKRGEDDRILIVTDCLKAEVWPTGYVTGIKAGTFVDRRTNARDNSFGLDIIDFLMGPGAEGGLPYEFGNKVHGNIAKHYVELPQICTSAGQIDARIISGTDFVAVRQSWKWTEAAPGYQPGSAWEQTIIFPRGHRYFFSSDRVQSINKVENLFLRTDLPCHIKHKKGDTFEEIYLSYAGRIPADAFTEDFAPNERYLYQRAVSPIPTRMIRAYKIRGQGMPWLAGMTLDPQIVSEAWCHQRGYVCFIQEIGGLPVEVGDSFTACYIIGYFNSVADMEFEYDRHRGFTSLAVTEQYWLLSEGVIVQETANCYRIETQGRQPYPERWRVLVHGKGEALINGKRVKINGEHIVEVP